MLDPLFVRDNLAAVTDGLRARGLDPERELEQFVPLETRRRRLIPELEGLKRQQNTAGDEIARANSMIRRVWSICSSSPAPVCPASNQSISTGWPRARRRAT